MRPYAAHAATLALAAALAAGLAARPTKDRPLTDPEVYAPGPEFKQLAARTAARCLVARNLADGRISLAEAAAVFRWLNDQPPRYQPWPGPEEVAVTVGLAGEVGPDSWPWVQAIRFAVTQAGDSGGTEVVAERLRAEYRAARAAGRLGDLRALSDEEGRALLNRGAAASEPVRRPHP